MNAVRIGSRRIGPGAPVFLIAEAGVNHNADLALARRLVVAAAQAGADAVKFQTFRAERVVTPAAPKAAYQRRAGDPDESQLEMIKKLELPVSAFRELQQYCRQQGILFLSTPFDRESAEALAELGVPAFKVPSGEITNLPLLERVGRFRKPVILSTGMATLAEVRTAVRTLTRAGARELILLHCVSRYPADPHTVNLRAMDTLRRTFRVPVGFSDHTLGIEIALAAAALGACVIEKHVTLDRTLPGPDHAMSLEPDQLAALVRGVRAVEAALGDGRKVPAPGELEVAAVARKSLVAAQDLPAGVRLTDALVEIKRPGTGIAPALRPRLVGLTTRQAIPAGTVFTWEMLGGRRNQERGRVPCRSS